MRIALVLTGKEASVLKLAASTYELRDQQQSGVDVEIRMLDQAQEQLIDIRRDSDQEQVDDELQIRVDDLGLSVPATNALKQEGLDTVGDLIQKTEEELLTLRNFTESHANQVKGYLARQGLSLRESGSSQAEGQSRGRGWRLSTKER
jgi:DNA-directed RNA polymerase alpha subunit